MRPLVWPFLSSKVNFMVNYSEFLAKYSNILFNMGPNACDWIIGAQESRENGLQTSNMTVWYKKDTTSIAISVLQSQFYGKLQ